MRRARRPVEGFHGGAEVDPRPKPMPPCDVDPKRESSPKLADSNRQLETIRNRRNPFGIKQMNFSNRPKKQLYHGRQTAGAKKGEEKACPPALWRANGNIPLLEFAVTGGKQRDMQILIATQNADPARIGVLSPPRAEESKDPSSDPKWELSMQSLRGRAEKEDRVHG
jgi:hypothetical protein